MFCPEVRWSLGLWLILWFIDFGCTSYDISCIPEWASFTRWAWLFCLAHRSNSLQVDMLPLLDTLFWIQDNQSSLYLKYAAYTAENQPLLIETSLVGLDQGSNPSSTFRTRSDHAATRPSMRLLMIFEIRYVILKKIWYFYSNG